MLKIHLEGHDNYYGIADVVRAFYIHPVEDKENGLVYCESAPDAELISSVLDDGSTSAKSVDGSINIVLPPVTAPVMQGREVKRSVYLAVSEIASRSVPWGCLTGIRPTLVAGEENSAPALSQKYFVRSDKAELALTTFKNEQRILDLLPPEDINIYVGIPFCPSRCEYCSFVSSDISHHLGKFKSYLDALGNELKAVGPSLNRRISTVYLGGGTPTVGDDGDFARLMDLICDNLKIDDRTEFTVEAGRADTITPAKLKAMKEHGVDRVCINPQTMNSETLAKLNRRHTAEDTVRVFELAREIGFDVINMDLIAGLKYETSKDFAESIRKIISLEPENITIHTLYKKRRAAISASDVLGGEGDDVDRAVSEGYSLLGESGYIPYYLYRQKDTGHGLENTGFAKEGTECLYNVAMMTDARDVLSFGAGGMSKRVYGQEGSKFRVERCPCIKDVIGYINSWQDMAKRKRDFFDII